MFLLLKVDVSRRNNAHASLSEHRKFFHLSASLIAVAGLQLDPTLTRLAAGLVLCAFACIEVIVSLKTMISYLQAIRCLDILPYTIANRLSNAFLVFIDEQDSPTLILTPIYLIVGIFGPILIDPIDSVVDVQLKHYAGVISVGVGDSLAAIYGRRYGRRRWHRRTGTKTIEGSSAMLVGQTLVAVLISHLLLRESYTFAPMTIAHLLAVSALCCCVEVVCTSMDNLLVSFVAYCLL